MFSLKILSDNIKQGNRRRDHEIKDLRNYYNGFYFECRRFLNILGQNIYFKLLLHFYLFMLECDKSAIYLNTVK